VNGVRLGSIYRPGRSTNWVKVKNPKAPAVRREGTKGSDVSVEAKEEMAALGNGN